MKVGIWVVCSMIDVVDTREDVAAGAVLSSSPGS